MLGYLFGGRPSKHDAPPPPPPTAQATTGPAGDIRHRAEAAAALTTLAAATPSPASTLTTAESHDGQRGPRLRVSSAAHAAQSRHHDGLGGLGDCADGRAVGHDGGARVARSSLVSALASARGTKATTVGGLSVIEEVTEEATGADGELVSGDDFDDDDDDDDDDRVGEKDREEDARVLTRGKGAGRASVVSRIASARPDLVDPFHRVLDRYAEMGVGAVNRAFSLAELFTYGTWHLAASSVRFSFKAAEETVNALDGIFGSTETSRTISTLVQLVRDELTLDNGAAGVDGSGRAASPAPPPKGLFARAFDTVALMGGVTKAVTAFSCLQVVTARRQDARRRVVLVFEGEAGLEEMKRERVLRVVLAEWGAAAAVAAEGGQLPREAPRVVDGGGGGGGSEEVEEEGVDEWRDAWVDARGREELESEASTGAPASRLDELDSMRSYSSVSQAAMTADESASGVYHEAGDGADSATMGLSADASNQLNSIRVNDDDDDDDEYSYALEMAKSFFVETRLRGQDVDIIDDAKTFILEAGRRRGADVCGWSPGAAAWNGFDAEAADGDGDGDDDEGGVWDSSNLLDEMSRFYAQQQQEQQQQQDRSFSASSFTSLHHRRAAGKGMSLPRRGNGGVHAGGGGSCDPSVVGTPLSLLSPSEANAVLRDVVAVDFCGRPMRAAVEAAVAAAAAAAAAAGGAGADGASPRGSMPRAAAAAGQLGGGGGYFPEASARRGKVGFVPEREARSEDEEDADEDGASVSFVSAVSHYDVSERSLSVSASASASYGTAQGRSVESRSSLTREERQQPTEATLPTESSATIPTNEKALVDISAPTPPPQPQLKSTDDGPGRPDEVDRVVANRFPFVGTLENLQYFLRFACAAYGKDFLSLFGTRVRDVHTTDPKVPANHISFAIHARTPIAGIVYSSYEDDDDDGGFGGGRRRSAAGSGERSGRAATQRVDPVTHYVVVDRVSDDILTDLKFDYAEYRGGKAHAGMLHGARMLADPSSRLFRAVRQALEDNPTFGLVLTGHSLGASMATLVACEWSTPSAPSPGHPTTPSTSSTSTTPTPFVTSAASGLPPGRPIHSYCYGPPCTASLGVSLATKGLVSNLVNGDDIVSNLSVGLLRDLKQVTVHLLEPESRGLAERIVARTVGWGAGAGSSRSKERKAVTDGSEGGKEAVGVVAVAERNEGGVKQQEEKREAEETEEKEEEAEEDEFFSSALARVSAAMTNERLYPCGDVFWMRSSETVIRDAKTRSTSTTVRSSLFYCLDMREIATTPRFSSQTLSNHTPMSYEYVMSCLTTAKINQRE
ncbi:hypothetical protein DFJ73DRAFT_802015 [Zopfochytrium polystomum]|nr:hypothetical protein DFJ73DRAFT_802015 [Zopfochytrium polystomum]